MAEEYNLPIEDTAREYYTVTGPSGNREARTVEQMSAAQKAYADNPESYKYPKYSIDNGRVRVSGKQSMLDTDLVRESSKILQNYFKGYDLSDEQTASNFNKALEEINSQIESNLKYQEYEKFLSDSNFSDKAYRNYVLAKEVMESTNPSKSKTIIDGYDKNGKWHDKDNDPWTWSDWINHWKTEMNPEERAKYWIQSLEALNKATKEGGDDNLYAALPFILMGSKDTQNAVAGALNFVNPFDDGKGWDDAKTLTPVYGFDDTDGLSVLMQSAVTQLGTGALELVGGTAEALNNPWGDLGTTNGTQYFGFDFDFDRDMPELSKEDFKMYKDIYDGYKKLPSESLDENGYLINLSPFERLKNEYGESIARRAVVADAFSTAESYNDFRQKLFFYENQGVGAFKADLERRINEMNQHVSDMSVYDPNAATAGVVLGTVARIAAEQAALSLVSGGALSAPNIAKTLVNAGYQIAKNAVNAIGLGQLVISKAPAVASGISAVAAGSAEGLSKAAKAIYYAGTIATWAVREVGEDAIRGLVDDAIMQNSFDSQGNLDPQKFAENVYMNAIMWGMAKAVKAPFKGIGLLAKNAKSRNIDGVELNTTQRYQLYLMQQALDDQNTRIIFRGWNDDGHPVIVQHGRAKVLDQLTPSQEVKSALEQATDEIGEISSPTVARTVEDILEDENIPEETKQKISDIVTEKVEVDENGAPKEGWEEDVKTKIQDSLTDDEIRQAFPDGTMKIGDETVKIDTREFTSGDVGRVGGQNFKTIDDAIEGVKSATTTKDFINSLNGVMRTARDFAKSWAEAVQKFATDHDMSVRDVMVELRNSRIAGSETLPGLKELWDTYWKPIQDKLLDAQEQVTGIRPVSHDFYFRDMVEGTFRPNESGSWTIDQTTTADILSGDTPFDLAASSTAKNTGKLGELAGDRLEYDPEVLAREFVASRVQTIWASNDMGKVFATMQEAHDAGEYNITEEQAAKSVQTVEQVSADVEKSDGVQKIQEMSNVERLDETFGDEEISQKRARIHELDDEIKGQQEQVARDRKDLEDLQPKTDAQEVVHNLSFEERAELAEKFVKRHPEYMVAYRRQNTGIDDWYSNGTGGAGDPTKFVSGGSDKGDLTNAVWMTLDRDWAEGAAKASANNYNGEPDYIVVMPIKKSLIVDAGGEQPSYRPELGEPDMVNELSWGDGRYYSLRRFSELNGNKAVLTRAVQKDNAWLNERDARMAAGKTPVSSAMEDKLNSKFYYNREIVLFKDLQPDALREGEEALLEQYNIDHRTSARAIHNSERELANSEKVLADLEAERARLSAEVDASVEARKAQKIISKVDDGKATEQDVDDIASISKKQITDAQKAFNDSAAKSVSAEQISKTSGYAHRGTRVNPGPVVGVNYMPRNPFGKFSGWVNDHFVKANSIKMQYGGYKADGTPVTMAITAYNGGYKMYAEAGSFARNVIVDVQNGSSLWDAINKQIYDNGFFIEPSKSQRAKYGALTVREQAARITDKIMDRMNKDARFSHAFNDDGTVKDTTALLSMLTTRFRSQGINDFTKFIKKANWDSFTKGEQSWLNKRMYEMTASTNKLTAEKIIGNIAKYSMGLRYRSNMWFNLKNGQLQLTECQRLFTLNKIADFGTTLKRLISDKDYRQRVSDYSYILAAESMGRGLTRTDLDNAADAMVKMGAGSSITKNGIITNVDNVKAKFDDFNDMALSSIEGGEYAKNYILIAGFVAAGEKQGLEGARLDEYVRNRFNTEALAGTKVGKIGLTDSKIGQFTFMYLGFPIRELTLQAHILRGGGLRGDWVGSLEYLAKMLGAKGVMWALEAPWGYSLVDQLGIDPFGWTEQYDQIQTSFEDRDPFWRWVDIGVQYNPFFQGAMTSALADIYFSYRAAEEAARDDYKSEHNGSTEGFEWSLADAGSEMYSDLITGLTPGYTAYSRVAGEMNDLDRGYHISEKGNRLYEANTDPANILWGAMTGRKNTANAQEYYQSANPIRGLVEGGAQGLGRQILRGNPFRGFREFDPMDRDTYQDWFDGSYQDQQNWATGIYAFKEEAQEIRDRYDRYAKTGTAVNDMASRENELSDLRDRLEKYVQAYVDKHPEGISGTKQNQLINIFNLGDYQPTLQEAFASAQGETDYSDWEAARNRYAQGDFPTAYGITQSKDGENTYTQSPQLQQVLSQQRYGISSEVAPIIKQMYNSQKFDTPLGNMTMKDYHDKVYAKLQTEWDKAKPDYKAIAKEQEAYLEQISKNVIQPILNTYGSAVLSAGKTSDIMQEFGKMLNGMIPSDEYRIDKKGKTLYQSTPYMTVDIPKWLNKNFSSYKKTVNTTDKAAQERIQAIRDSVNAGRTSTAKAKARALVQDIGNGKASVSRDELEWLQRLLNE